MQMEGGRGIILRATRRPRTKSIDIAENFRLTILRAIMPTLPLAETSDTFLLCNGGPRFFFAASDRRRYLSPTARIGLPPNWAFRTRVQIPRSPATTKHDVQPGRFRATYVVFACRIGVETTKDPTSTGWVSGRRSQAPSLRSHCPLSTSSIASTHLPDVEGFVR
jgi:hypothetical protein